ncbi:unnamed protein product [Menidia menidia]|uniref:(Atlantic silverside) hypothetical protein n=1 Tax=Menidia menidia TaxID=238744 RepID=A0A8S4BYV4_9TELE|nr:unnamed protein product [Menidia menidia]
MWFRANPAAGGRTPAVAGPPGNLKEVQKAVNAAQSLHQRWKELLQEGVGASKEEIDWTTNELRNSLRSIEWDLEDLDETINILEACNVSNYFLINPECIVESNPKKFNLDTAELSKRKAFITRTRSTVKPTRLNAAQRLAAELWVCFEGHEGSDVESGRLRRREGQTGTRAHQRTASSLRAPESSGQNLLCCVQALLGERGAQGPIWQPGPDKFGRLDRQLQNANSQFIEEQQVQQQVQSPPPPPEQTRRLIAEQQDEQLQLVSGTIGVLKNMSERIGLELDEQAVMLDDFGHEIDSTQSRLDNVMKKLAKVSHMTSDRRQWCAIGVLLAILLVIVILFFIL